MFIIVFFVCTTRLASNIIKSNKVIHMKTWTKIKKTHLQTLLQNVGVIH